MLLFPAVLSAQGKTNLYNGNYHFQFGVSLKALVEIDISRHTQNPQPVVRLSADVGVGSEFLASWLYPAVNVELQCYNGGLGSRNKEKFVTSPFCLDVVGAITMTAGFHNVLARQTPEGLGTRNAPLYYFGNFVHPALQNPFDGSISIGTDLIASTDHNKKSQRVGFFDLHLYRFQAAYFNDGGVPFSNIYLGDRNDRYYTGGLVLSVNNPTYTSMSNIELSYYKFTGYTKNAFEVANKLNLAYTSYHSDVQKYYNKSLWSLGVSNPSKGYGVQVNSYNAVGIDVQHLIHWGLFDAFHIVPYKSYWSVAGNYHWYNRQISVQ